MDLHSKKTALIAMCISGIILGLLVAVELAGFVPEIFSSKVVTYTEAALIIIFGIGCYRYFERHPPAAH